MKPSKREASSPVSPTSEKPSKKHRPLDYGGPTMEAPAAITPHGPLQNRHLQAVINAAAADGADHSLSNGHHHHHQKGHHTPITTTITQVFNDSSLSSPITVTNNSNSSTPNNLNVSKRRSIVNLNRSARKDLTSYATKEQEMTPGGGGTPGTPNDQRGEEAPTLTLSRSVEYKNNLKSLHEIMSKSFDPKRAFNYNFINIMSSFINNDQGNMDFKLIALSLDAGTRVWMSKVDLVYRNTQKVSNSLMMATGDERAGGANFDNDDEEGLFENSFLRNEKKKAAAKKRRKMAPTIVANTDTINGKLEMNIAVDPLFHRFSAAFDVGNVNSMLMTNLASDPAGVLLLDSAEMLNFDDAYKQQEKQPQPPTTVDLSAFNITLGSGGRQRDLESEEYGGGITVCPPMGDFDITDFSFNDRDASIDHLVSGSMTSPMKSSAFPATGGPYDGGQGRPSFEFDIDAPVDDVDVGDDDYGGDHDGDGAHHSGDEEGGGGAHGKDHPQANQLYNQQDASLLEANMMDILPANKNEFFNKNFLRRVFRKVPFFKLLNGPGLDETAADGSAAAAAAAAEKAARPKRTRPTFEENTYAASKEALEELFEPPTQEVKDSLSFALPTLNRWSINSELMHMKDDYGFETRHLKALFTKPDTYFNGLQRELKTAMADAQLEGGGGATTSATGIDDYGGDDFGWDWHGSGGASDYEDDGVGGGNAGDGGTGAEDYNYERPLPDFNIADDYRSQAQSGATGGGEPELNGHVDPLDIDYCRVAKKVDMKRVKRGMWDIIEESTTTELLSTDDPSQPASEAASSGGLQSGSHGLTFSSLRQILPNHIGPNLNENLSVHTSFVALLHLCNDKDLALAPITAGDHSDFVIMKPNAAD